jgi:hypothetical protein
MADTVEKVAAGLFQFPLQKIGLSDRTTNRSRTPVKGKKTPENLARTTVSDFFNSIGRLPSDAVGRTRSRFGPVNLAESSLSLVMPWTGGQLLYSGNPLLPNEAAKRAAIILMSAEPSRLPRAGKVYG